MNIKSEINKRKRLYTHEGIARKLNVSRAYLTQVINGKRKSPKLTKKIQKLISIK